MLIRPVEYTFENSYNDKNTAKERCHTFEATIKLVEERAYALWYAHVHTSLYSSDTRNEQKVLFFFG